ncbi:MAG: type IV-A pilus assembly ATPase PilB [Candidatus Competibacterales bacterium]
MALTPNTPNQAQDATPKVTLSGLARILVKKELIDEETALKTIEKAAEAESPFISYIVDQRLVPAADLAHHIALELGYPIASLGSIDLEDAPIKDVKEDLIRRLRALPLYKRGRTLYVGMPDPTDLKGLEEIKFQTSMNPEPVVVAETGFNLVVEKAITGAGDELSNLDETADRIEVVGEDGDENIGADPEETPIVRFVNQMLLSAINQGASDLHFEPYEKTFRVRFRQDGILREITTPPIAMASRIAARIKVMAQMDIAERRVPQDGRIKLRLSRRRSIDFRVNTLPTMWGEKIVLRILDASAAALGVDILGFAPDQREVFINTIKQPQGLVLVTGPTGSGKTVTLYTALNILNQEQVNISTCEDPVEINLAGINQVNVNNKTGLTFANALRAFLRQDPDIVMVGEIRDLETAEIAIKAAQTGHMVLSTLHTNSAPQTLTRLANMGVAPYNIASSVSLVIAQRLGRRLCSVCREEEYDVPPEMLIQQGFSEDEIDDLTIFKAVGCDLCVGGYKGRVGVYEVMPLSEEMGRIIMSGGNAIQLADQALKEGVSNLRRSGLNKVRQGITSLEEINRITID